jgi:cytochrome c556
MNKRLLLTGLAIALGAGLSQAAFSQVKPEILVKQRQAAMTLQGKYFGLLAAMAQGKVPYNKDAVVRNAELLSALSKMPWDGFAESTKDEKSVKTAALPTIWKDADKFKQAQERFQDEVSKLVQVSKRGDEAAIKAQIGAIGKSCGACHGDFREKQQ